MKTKSGIEYELKQLSLAEREICNNAKATIINFRRIEIDKPFTIKLTWLRFGLKSIEGIEITDENRDEQLNTLSDVEMDEIMGEISERTNGGTKKKS